MIITQINDVKWMCSAVISDDVNTTMAFETAVFYLILNHIKDDCLPDIKHKINFADLINNDVVGVLIMKTNLPLISALKTACLNFLKNNSYAPQASVWSQILKAVKLTNSMQTYAHGFILNRSSKYQLQITAIISKRKTMQFIEERANESIRNSFILKKVEVTVEFIIFHNNSTEVNSVTNRISKHFLF